MNAITKLTSFVSFVALITALCALGQPNWYESPKGDGLRCFDTANETLCFRAGDYTPLYEIPRR